MKQTGVRPLTAIQKILKIARSEIGVKESPAGSNKVKYNTDYYGREVSGQAYPWCCVWVWWIFKQAGLSSLLYGGEKVAYCPYLMKYFQNKGQFITSDYRTGDIVLFNWSGGKLAEHVGIVESVSSNGSIITIEGNTSVSNDSNGGCVMRRVRSVKHIIGAGRPAYGKEEKTVNISLNQLSLGSAGNQVKTLQHLLIAKGYSCGKCGADGDFGSNTLKALKAFQKANGLEVDGICGVNTWNKLLK